MKKLIVTLAAVAFGVSVHAAAFDWSAESISGYNGASSEDNLIFWVSSANTVTADNYKNIGTFGHAAAWGGVVDDAGEAEGSVSGYNAGDTATGYLVVFNSADLDTATHFYQSENMSTTANASGIFVPGILEYDLSDSATASNWTAVSGGGGSGGDVPEPTSGLLLALGGAMLALRRRRA